MANYITIDGGTTNTRISLVKDGQIIDTLKIPVGARAGIQDKNLLKETVKKGIVDLLAANRTEPEDIVRILAAGMITSEFGLYKLDHTVVPAGMKELHHVMGEVCLEDISEIPFVFMRGVKTACTTLEEADMMRGEETELMGIAGWTQEDGTESVDSVYILPGSHSKIIRTDKEGRIAAFSTMLTGEMAAALSQNTILKDAVSFENAAVDETYLLKGYEYCVEKGINESLFKVRILKNLFGQEPNQIYSFFMGVILCDEIRRVLAYNAGQVVIGGKKQIKEAMALILKKVYTGEVKLVSDEVVDASSALGMIRIYEYQG